MAHLPPLFLSSFLFPPPFLGFSPLLQRRREEEEEVLVLAPRARFLLSSSRLPAGSGTGPESRRERKDYTAFAGAILGRGGGGIWGREGGLGCNSLSLLLVAAGVFI